jgi:hypothetical protein
MQTKLTKESTKSLHEAADMIQGCFNWGDTDEGGPFWGGVVELLRKKAFNGTSDGKPWVEPEPPLTDQDACVWPRLLVMVRDEDHEPWRGPVSYLGKSSCQSPRFVVDSKKYGDRVWEQARRATPAEIEAAHK